MRLYLADSGGRVYVRTVTSGEEIGPQREHHAFAWLERAANHVDSSAYLIRQVG
jgi:hypothetical protein